MEVYTRLFPRGEDPLGARIRIGRKHFTVIGVVEDLGSVLGESKNRFVYIPVNTFLKIFGSRTSIEIKVKAADITLLQQAVDEAYAAMRKSITEATSKQVIGCCGDIIFITCL